MEDRSFCPIACFGLTSHPKSFKWKPPLTVDWPELWTFQLFNASKEAPQQKKQIQNEQTKPSLPLTWHLTRASRQKENDLPGTLTQVHVSKKRREVRSGHLKTIPVTPVAMLMLQNRDTDTIKSAKQGYQLETLHTQLFKGSSRIGFAGAEAMYYLYKGCICTHETYNVYTVLPAYVFALRSAPNIPP